jgi:hypothetical protein
MLGQPSGETAWPLRTSERLRSSAARRRRRAQSRSHARRRAICSFSRAVRLIRAAFCASSLRRAISFVTSPNVSVGFDRSGSEFLGLGISRSLLSLPKDGHGRMREHTLGRGTAPPLYASRPRPRQRRFPTGQLAAAVRITSTPAKPVRRLPCFPARKPTRSGPVRGSAGRCQGVSGGADDVTNAASSVASRSLNRALGALCS